ncbi:DUF4396 domain-containing protein [Streptosporangium sp. NPDC051022]|uniref:DUF4396 domain-containing protein n=1 Tax=Streptosporangium sp. NPDC051022 TaxID=3155752 RepID=UPI00343EFCE2
MSESMRHMDHAGHEDHTSHAGHGDHSGHGDHAGHGEAHAHDHHAHAGHPAKATWRMAASATLHCLTGCAIGEVLGMVVGTALGWSNAPTLVLSIVLAFFFGYALTLTGLRRAGVGWREAVRLALAADTVSIIVMEITDNAVMVAVPGAMDAGLGAGLFWGALALSLLTAFLVTVPVNKWIIGRGRGHAVVHAYHH